MFLSSVCQVFYKRYIHKIKAQYYLPYKLKYQTLNKHKNIARPEQTWDYEKTLSTIVI